MPGKPSPERTAWHALKQRCFNRNNPGFKNYGTRGITICDRWLTSFENFIADMGPRPSAQHSIDRIDNDGNYEPANCRWATAAEQARNRRANRIVIIGGVSKVARDWAHDAGVSTTSILRRMDSGWPVDDLLRPRRSIRHGVGGFVGAKMTADRVREIREARAAGVSVVELAKRYDISRGFASDICTGKKCSHVAGSVSGVKRCALCGERGHNRRTCTRLRREAA